MKKIVIRVMIILGILFYPIPALLQSYYAWKDDIEEEGLASIGTWGLIILMFETFAVSLIFSPIATRQDRKIILCFVTLAAIVYFIGLYYYGHAMMRLDNKRWQKMNSGRIA